MDTSHFDLQDHISHTVLTEAHKMHNKGSTVAEGAKQTKYTTKVLPGHRILSTNTQQRFHCCTVRDIGFT